MNTDESSTPSTSVVEIQPDQQSTPTAEHDVENTDSLSSLFEQLSQKMSQNTPVISNQIDETNPKIKYLLPPRTKHKQD